MSVNGKIGDSERAIVLEEVAGHPVILAGAGDVANLLAKDVPVAFGAGFAGRTDVADGKALIVGHGHESGFAIARVALNAYLFRVDGRIGFKVIERAACAPRPCA